MAGVTPALHTPLISASRKQREARGAVFLPSFLTLDFEVTNAISGSIVVGGMLQLSGPVLSARVACALAAVFLSSVNIVGGFAVTARMLDMFREDANPKKALAERT